MTPSPEFDQGEFVRALLDPDLPPPGGLKAAHGLPARAAFRRLSQQRGRRVDRRALRTLSRMPATGRRGVLPRDGAALRPRFPSPRPDAVRIWRGFRGIRFGFRAGARVCPICRTSPVSNTPWAAPITRRTPRPFLWTSCAPCRATVSKPRPLRFIPRRRSSASKYPIVSIWRANMAPDPPQIIGAGPCRRRPRRPASSRRRSACAARRRIGLRRSPDGRRHVRRGRERGKPTREGLRPHGLPSHASGLRGVHGHQRRKLSWTPVRGPGRSGRLLELETS